MKHCRIWFLHQNPDGPKNSKEFYEFRFMSTFELRFPGKYRFDFVNWDLIRKLPTCGRGFGWNKNCFEPCIRILRVRIFLKSMSIDVTPYSKSTFYVTADLIFSIELSGDRFTLAQANSIEKTMHFDICIRILIVRKFQHVLLILTYFNIRIHVCP